MIEIDSENVAYALLDKDYSEYVFRHISSDLVKVSIVALSEEEAWEILKKLSLKQGIFILKDVIQNGVVQKIDLEKGKNSESVYPWTECAAYCKICNKENGGETQVTKVVLVNGTMIFKLKCGHSITENFGVMNV